VNALKIDTDSLAHDEPMKFFPGFLALDSTQQRSRISSLFLLLTAGFGLTQIWACRYELNPDSMDYLDIARALAAGDWAAIANGYWGTLNSVLLAPLFRFHLSPQRELLLAHLEGILILLLAFFSFRFFLNSVLDTISLRQDAEKTELRSLPEWALCVLGYSLFLWSSLIVVPVMAIGPDFAQLRIVAEIMAPDEPDFWRRPEETRQGLYAAFQKTGALWIIGQPPSALVNLLDARWKQVGTTTYYCYSLRPVSKP
jgi:hypothetical protein